MLRKISKLVMILALALLLCPLTACADQDCCVKLDDLYMKIEIPSGMTAFTRDSVPSEADQERFGFAGDTAQAVFHEPPQSHFDAESIYMKALDERKSRDIIVDMSPSSLESFDFLDDDMIKAVLPLMLTKFGDMGMTVTNSDLYKHGQNKFVRIFLRMKEGGSTLYCIQYSTAHDSKSINIIYRSYGSAITADDEQLMNRVADSIAYGDTPASLGFASPAGAQTYTCDATSMSLVLPEGWSVDESAPEKNQVITFFYSDKSEDFIIYAAADIWSNMSSAEKGDFNRADYTNSIFTKSEIAQMYGVSEKNVSKVTCNGVEYFKCLIDNKEYIEYGAGVDAPLLVYFNNGYMHTFMFTSAEGSEYYPAFEALMNSVEYASEV